MTHNFTGISGFNPPFPEAATKDETTAFESSKKKYGQRLLSLVRLIEKKTCDDNYEESLDEAVDLLNYLISLYSRRGLLQGEGAKAERILSLEKSTTKEKKRSKKGSSNNELQINTGESNNDSTASGVQEESLIFTSIIRILKGTNNDDSSETNTVLSDDQALLAALAAELCLAISQRVNTTTEFNTCTLAEYELMAQSGKPVLAGLVTTMRSIESDIKKYTLATTKSKPKFLERCLTLAFLDENKHVAPIISCLKAASSLVNLFGTKLSRSITLISDLRNVAWRFLTLPNDSIQHSAAKLIACIPLAGGTDRKTPSDLWIEATSDAVSMLLKVLHNIAPLNKPKKQNENKISDHAQNTLQAWMAFVREDIFEESARLISFHRFIFGLTRCFQSLLSQDAWGQNSHYVLLEIKLDVENALDVVESFLSFPISVETVLYKTKKRLRNEAVDGGLLSPRVLATEVANQIKLLGHEILDYILASLGGPSLLPFARRITRISYASLLTSCSGTVRKVMDPTAAVQLDGKKRRWLHLSIPLRRVAVNTLKVVITSFGSDRSGTSNGRSSVSRSDGELAAALVVGCLIEEISSKEKDGDFDECWGTFKEREELITTCTDCLHAVLVSCGGYTTTSIRSLIDSTVATGLSEMDTSASGVFSWSSVKIGFLELASSCVTTPWDDGAATSITNILAQVARKHESDMDEKVCLAAKAALRLCGATGVPRAPAILYVSRATSANASSTQRTDTSASDIIKNIQSTRIEASAVRATAEQAEREKAEEKRRRDEQREEEKAAKRKRTSWTKDTTGKNDSETEKSRELKPKAADTTEIKQHQEEKISQESVAVDRLKNDEPNEASPLDGDDNEQNKPLDSGDDFMMRGESHHAVEVQSSSKPDEKMDLQDSDEDDEFPEIVGGGPDSDDE